MSNKGRKMQFRKKVIGALAFASGAALVLSGCTGGPGATEGKPTEIKILVAAPLTGSGAESGQDMVHGAELAAEYLNGKGGVQGGELKGAKFTIEGVDDKGTTEAATTIAARMVDDTSVFALTGFITSGQAQAAGTVLDSAGLGLISSMAGADFLTDDADNIATTVTGVRNFGAVAGKFVVEKLGAKSVASIAGDYSFLDSYYKGLDEQLGTGGAKNVSKQTYTEGATDFSTLLTSIESANPDVLLNGAFMTDAGKIVSQARTMGMQQPIVDLLGEGWGESFYEAAGSAVSKGDIYRMDPIDAFPEDGSLSAEMSKKFKEEYGKTMPASAYHTFDSVLAISAAIDAGATAREQLIETLPKISGEGLLGKIGFTEDLRPSARVLTMSKVTGSTPDDRVLAAQYIAYGDGRIEEVK